MKRLFDVSVVLLSLPATATVALAFAALLAIELRGNPLFVQKRIGLNGAPFLMYKLRTMRSAATNEQPSYAVADWNTYVFSPSTVRDARITRFGAIARSTSVDELPNLLNVFLGQMSLVGPRPEIPEIVAQYPPEYRRRHAVQPGIAGWAQVNGRSDLAYDAIMQYDLEYVERRSFWFDLRILWRTAMVVAAGSGAR